MESKTIDFIILGAQKGGSTWLYNNLNCHPEIYCPKKELHFFSNDTNYKKGINYYHSFYSDIDENKVIGEKTPEYLNLISPNNPQASIYTHKRIFDYNPDMKFIIVLRNPINRLISAANHMLRTNRITPFESLEDITFGKSSHKGEEFSLLENGKYASSIIKYYELFPKENFLIMFFEDEIKNGGLQTMQKVCKFLNISFDSGFFPKINLIENEYKMSFPALYMNHLFPNFRMINNRLNHLFKPYKLKLEEDLKNRLIEFYEKPNRNLIKLVGYLPSSWHSKR